MRGGRRGGDFAGSSPPLRRRVFLGLYTGSIGACALLSLFFPIHSSNTGAAPQSMMEPAYRPESGCDPAVPASECTTPRRGVRRFPSLGSLVPSIECCVSTTSSVDPAVILPRAFWAEGALARGQSTRSTPTTCAGVLLAVWGFQFCCFVRPFRFNCVVSSSAYIIIVMSTQRRIARRGAGPPGRVRSAGAAGPAAVRRGSAFCVVSAVEHCGTACLAHRLTRTAPHNSASSAAPRNGMNTQLGVRLGTRVVAERKLFRQRPTCPKAGRSVRASADGPAPNKRAGAVTQQAPADTQALEKHLAAALSDAEKATKAARAAASVAEKAAKAAEAASEKAQALLRVRAYLSLWRPN